MTYIRRKGLVIKCHGQDELRFRYRFKSPTSSEMQNADHASRIEQHSREVERFLGSAENASNTQPVLC